LSPTFHRPASASLFWINATFSGVLFFGPLQRTLVRTLNNSYPFFHCRFLRNRACRPCTLIGPLTYPDESTTSQAALSPNVLGITASRSFTALSICYRSFGEQFLLPLRPCPAAASLDPSHQSNTSLVPLPFLRGRFSFKITLYAAANLTKGGCFFPLPRGLLKKAPLSFCWPPFPLDRSARSSHRFFSISALSGRFSFFPSPIFFSDYCPDRGFPLLRASVASLSPLYPFACRRQLTRFYFVPPGAVLRFFVSIRTPL